MTGTPPLLRIALYGLPGAGKSTSAGLVRDILTRKGRRPAVVKLGAPLYDVQDAFHRRLDSPLESGRQDGALLNFLGSHFRARSATFLADDLAERCAYAVVAGADALVCDDARPTDIDGLRSAGFAIVRVSAPDELRQARKAGRDDLTAGDDRHPSELGAELVVADHEVHNAGSTADLGEALARVVDLMAAQRAPRGSSAADQQRRAIEALVGRARAAISARYHENVHQIGAAILTTDGRVYTGIHLEAMVGRASICAEAVALGAARAAGASGIVAVAAVRHPKPAETDQRIRLVPPCGLCRELLLDYGNNLLAVVESDGVPVLSPLKALLPNKYIGTKWGAAAQPSTGPQPVDRPLSGALR